MVGVTTAISKKVVFLFNYNKWSIIYIDYTAYPKLNNLPFFSLYNIDRWIDTIDIHNELHNLNLAY